jgi:hypothetical protein
MDTLNISQSKTTTISDAIQTTTQKIRSQKEELQKDGTDLGKAK